jgi:hypothetical protein
LDLCGDAITDEGLAHLEAMPELRCVDLGGTKVSQAGVERFRRLRPKCLCTSYGRLLGRPAAAPKPDDDPFAVKPDAASEDPFSGP